MTMLERPVDFSLLTHITAEETEPQRTDGTSVSHIGVMRATVSLGSRFLTPSDPYTPAHVLWR